MIGLVFQFIYVAGIISGEPISLVAVETKCVIELIRLCINCLFHFKSHWLVYFTSRQSIEVVKVCVA